MENLGRTPPSRMYWRFFPLGLAFLLFVVFLYGVPAITPVRANPGTLYVDGVTGSDNNTCGTIGAPCQTISYTLNMRASDGDTILIAAGTYTENVVIDGITLTLRGGYTISGTQWLTDTGQTIIHGNNTNRTMVIHGNNSVLENLTITSGKTPADQCWGGGVWISNGDVTIRSSLITDNEADCSAGGIEVNSDLGPAHLTLEDSVISHNLSKFRAGGITLWNASATLIRTQIVSNTASDGAQGFGGGLGIYQGSQLAIEASVIEDNYARLHGGAIEVQDSTLNMTNTLVISNTAANINALALQNSAVTIQNSTFANNNPTGTQAILAFDPATSTLDMQNSIMWNNALNIQWDGPTATLHLSYSDIEGCGSSGAGWNAACGNDGGGNINADPHFVDADHGNFRLNFDSPAIDAGSASHCPTTDLDGQPRPTNGDGDSTTICDMGAYEAGTMICGVSQGGNYTFNDQSNVTIDVSTKNNLDCLYVDEMNMNHPHATSGLRSGRYWLIHGFQSNRTGADGFSVNLTLPTDFEPDDKDKLCRYTGIGQQWDCAADSHTDHSITRNKVGEFSEWAVGNNVGPTKVHVRMLQARSAAPWGALGLLLLAFTLRRRQR